MQTTLLRQHPTIYLQSLSFVPFFWHLPYPVIKKTQATPGKPLLVIKEDTTTALKTVNGNKGKRSAKSQKG